MKKALGILMSVSLLFGSCLTVGSGSVPESTEAVTEAVTEEMMSENETEAATETVTETEVVTEAITEAVPETEEVTETEAVTEVVTEAITEAVTETEEVTETEAVTEAITEEITEAVTETEEITETEAATEATTEEITEAVTETEEITETEAATEAVTEAVTETEEVTETEAATEAVTEAVPETEEITETEAITEAVTEKVTETEVVTEAVTEVMTESETVTETEIETEIETEVVTEISTEKQETAAEWEQTIPDKLTGEWAVDVLAVARTQLSYAESTIDVETDANGIEKGFTRYGAWYGETYGEWDAMFVSFCLYYAEISEENFPYESDCAAWVQKLREEKLFEEKEGYTPEEGNILFLDLNQDGISDHTAIVAEAISDDGITPVRIKVIEGGINDCVQYAQYELSDSRIVGYGTFLKQIIVCEKQGHLHDKECLDTAGNLICTKAEHIHESACITGVMTKEEEAQEEVKMQIALVTAFLQEQQLLSAGPSEENTTATAELKLIVTNQMGNKQIENVELELYSDTVPDINENEVSAETLIYDGKTYYKLQTLVTTSEGVTTELPVSVYDSEKQEEVAVEYLLRETKAADGYSYENIWAQFGFEKGQVVIKNTRDNICRMNSNGEFQIVNYQLFELPDTGGIGTQLFKIAGAAIMLIAFAFLLIKRRKK